MTDPRTSQAGRMVIDLRPGEALAFGDIGVRVVMEGKSGRAARLCITSPRDVRIEREGAEPARSKHGIVIPTDRGG